MTFSCDEIIVFCVRKKTRYWWKENSVGVERRDGRDLLEERPPRLFGKITVVPITLYELFNPLQIVPVFKLAFRE